MNRSKPCCPKCGSLEYQQAGVTHRHFKLWVFLLGGWIFALLHGLSRKQQVRCVQCDTFFSIRTRTSRVALVLLLLIVALIVISILLESLR
jgi:predicted nucleic acid-binding Zn ribbon protein